VTDEGERMKRSLFPDFERVDFIFRFIHIESTLLAILHLPFLVVVSLKLTGSRLRGIPDSL
jgi:hypothetical protein